LHGWSRTTILSHHTDVQADNAAATTSVMRQARNESLPVLVEMLLHVLPYCSQIHWTLYDGVIIRDKLLVDGVVEWPRLQTTTITHVG